MELILILLAPSIQIIFILFRLGNKIVLPVGAITIIAMFAGVAISILVANNLHEPVTNQGYHPHCSMVTAAFLLCGMFVSLIVIPIIGILGGIIWHFKNKKEPILKTA